MTLLPGRGAVDSTLPDLEQLRRTRADGGREVILLDGREDARLRVFLTTVKDDQEYITDERARAKRLAVLVAARLGGGGARDDIVAASEAHVARIGSKVVLIGELRAGVCRHRALLYKYCADRTGYGRPSLPLLVREWHQSP